jgi:hypothetical protein
MQIRVYDVRHNNQVARLLFSADDECFSRVHTDGVRRLRSSRNTCFLKDRFESGSVSIFRVEGIDVACILAAVWGSCIPGAPSGFGLYILHSKQTKPGSIVEYATTNDATTNDATTNECYNERMLQRTMLQRTNATTNSFYQ